MTRDDFDTLFRAFNRHDIDDVMSYFHDDVIFETVSGDNAHGTRIEGKAAVRAQFEATWGTMPDVQWRNESYFLFTPERIVSECTFIATNPDGTRQHADSVDLFTLKDGKIASKRAFRKNRPALKAA
ncbi:nuclear transport factor 2 family protein [uncultured Roseobacter sp.]|uniref:nuclear transport factor 2 family protein n=1 Tax=uncultured Roseobacter sp. TaxID=114847 RepID=UPI00263720C1|nr:nuclear transport factor 2 family protein [uncultured Roseobacter sp.]